MRADLIDLLRQREIVHPSKLVSMTFAPPRTLRMDITGFPWWRDNPIATEGEISFVFDGIADGALDFRNSLFLSDDDEVLETFEVRSLAEVDWAQPAEFAIYANGPMRASHEVYRTVHDFLVSKRSFFLPERFLNCGNALLSDFQKITASESYLVAKAPSVIRKLVCDELDKQGVAYSVIKTPFRSEAKFWVRLEGMDVLCDAAFAEWAD